MERNFLQKLAVGTSNVREVRVPGTDDVVKISLLSNQDVLDATIEADKIFRNAEVTVSMQNIGIYENEKEVQCLYRACKDAEGNPLAKDITEFRRLLTIPVKELLASAYNEFNAECNLSVFSMSDNEFDTLLETVKKNPNTISSVSSIITLRRLVEFLVKQSTK